MIYTITFSPSLDYYTYVNDFLLGAVNRANKVKMSFGGKGLNVSKQLLNLGVESIALGFIGGFVGEEIADLTKKSGLNTHFFQAEGTSRINVKIKSHSETEINATGVVVTEDDYNKFLDYVKKIEDKSYFVIAGAVPNSIHTKQYNQLLDILIKKKCKIIIDTSGEKLALSLKAKPYLIKPNQNELNKLAKMELDTNEEIVNYCSKLIKQGVKNVIVSRGSAGAIMLADDSNTYFIKAPFIKTTNSTGAGDSMIASCIASDLKGLDKHSMIRNAVATGTAKSMIEGFPTVGEIENVLKLI